MSAKPKPLPATVSRAEFRRIVREALAHQREIDGLAAGFDNLVSRMETLEAREFAMRHSARREPWYRWLWRNRMGN